MSQPIPPEIAANPQESAAAPQPSRWRYGVIAAVAVLLVFGALAMILNGTLFRIRKVAVIGNRAFSWQQIIDNAGITGDLTYFTVDREAIARNIEKNPYLIFEDLEMNFPNGMTLYVQERYPIACMQYSSSTYQLAADGMVLKWEGSDAVYPSLITVTGLIPSKTMRVGTVIQTGESALNAYLQVMQELNLQGFAGEVSELILSETDSLKLVTRNGYIVKLGDVTDMRAKIGTMRAVWSKLRAMETGDGYIDVTGILETDRPISARGIIDASVPGEAIYSPPNL